MQDSLSNARRTTPAFVLALALLGASGFGGWKVWQQVRMAPGTSIALDALAPLAASRSSDMRPASSKAVARGPGWEQLDTPQKLALYPLAPRWAALSEQQKRQWLLIAQSFSQLPEAEQERLHNRMTEWASLSAQQRSQARLNYAATKRLAPDSKRAQWEAYQALSSDEKTPCRCCCCNSASLSGRFSSSATGFTAQAGQGASSNGKPHRRCQSAQG